MSIMTRILKLCKADIHGVMDQLEDKELLIKQHLRDMETNLLHKKAHLKQIEATSGQIRSDLAVRQNEIAKLEVDLTLALKKEKDDIAKMLIRKQRIQQKHCEHLQKQCETLAEDQRQLTQLIEEQQLHYETLKVKAATFCRQAEQSRFYETNTVPDQNDLSYTVDENEIELEFMRRKDRLQEEGGTA